MGMFTDDERKRLAALLTAADQIREASIVAKAPPLSLGGTVGPDGSLEQQVTVFESEAFRSLAMSMRLVYMNDEPANFGSICNILYKRGDAPLQDAVAETRQAYNDFLKKSKMFQFNLHGRHSREPRLARRRSWRAGSTGSRFTRTPTRGRCSTS